MAHRRSPFPALPAALSEDLPPLALLLVLTLPWWIATTCPLIYLDDPTYILHNPAVLAGLTPRSIAWAFTSVSPSYWCPLTWLSLMLDVSLWGAGPAGPAGFHATNVLLHIANAALVYLLLKALTRRIWESFTVAALFAMHPLRVESVAWVTERKDVLAIFFGLLALLAYVRYTRAPAVGRYLVLCACFILSLMAKPLFVTLPLLLLLLDYWPLERFASRKPGRLLLEKLPLFALAFAAALLTVLLVILYPPSDALRNPFPLSLRLENAVVMLALSLRDSVYFGGLSLFYPQAPAIPPGQIIAAAALLLALAIGALALVRRRPALGRPVVVGLLWFFVAMLPVLNIAQAGEQSRADRFSYLPSIGLLVALVWPLAGWAVPAGRFRLLWPRLRIALAAGAILACTYFTVDRLDLWRNPLALYLDGIAHTGDNWMLERAAASVYLQRAPKAPTPAARLHDYQQALLHDQRALAAHPGDGYQHNNVGVALALNGRLAEALEEFRRARELRPTDPSIEANYTNTLAELRRRQGGPGQ